MVVNPKTTRKRGAGGVGQGAARKDAGAVRREKRRAAILAAALEEFAARGFAATRLDDVARRARIAKGTIYLYFRDVIARVLPVIRARLGLAVERGELPHDALARFPQLLVAPALVAIIWNGLFGRLAPLDIRDLMRAHLEVLFGSRSAT